MVLSENWTLVPPSDLRTLVELARVAEATGVDTVMISEHVVLGRDSCATAAMLNPRDYAAPGNQDPATPWPDSIVLASAIAMATTQLRIALAAVIAPLRHPLLLAKQWTTLDLLTEGRLVVQPTVSWSADEYASLDVDFAMRGAILDEQLEAIYRACVAEPNASSSFRGRHFAYDDVWCEPRRGVPVSMWFGGERLHRALVERIVKYGAGFHPFGTPTAEELDRLSRALSESGRSIDDLELVGGIRGDFSGSKGSTGSTGSTGVADLDAALSSIPEKVAAGYRSICFKPSMFTDDVRDVPTICRRVVATLESA